MIVAVSSLTKQRISTAWIAGIGMSLCVLICMPVLYNYIPWTSVNFLIGCITLPLLLRTNKGNNASYRYTVAGLFFCGVYFLLPVKTCLYVALIAALLGIWEANYGKTTVMAVITLLLMSPVAQYFADTFSFPLRLRLTKVAGGILNAVGIKSEVAGNVITCGAADFSVDPACMGLNMILTSLLCTILIVGLQEHKEQKRLPAQWIIAVLSATVILNVLANLLRIVVLVHFHIMPNNPMHEVMGIVCLIVYALAPVMWLVKLILKHKAIIKTAYATVVTPLRYSKQLQWAVLALMGVAVIAMKKPIERSRAELPRISGYKASWYDNDIARLENNYSLVYLKRLKGFYFSEHNPMLCWTGSGYVFSQIDNGNVEGVNACIGVLEKSGERLYTAWWYDNGRYHTSGMDWRLKAMKGSNDFYIVNVTTADMTTLAAEVKRLANDKELRVWVGTDNSTGRVQK